MEENEKGFFFVVILGTLYVVFFHLLQRVKSVMLMAEEIIPGTGRKERIKGVTV